jgi:hypothetical protein
MIDDGLWVPRARREPRIQQPRRRRPCRGELIQIEGSDPEWFEDRAGRCTLLAFVDDATSELMELLFCESESAFSYFAALRSYLEQHGKPVALYSDKADVFQSARKNMDAHLRGHAKRGMRTLFAVAYTGGCRHIDSVDRACLSSTPLKLD